MNNIEQNELERLRCENEQLKQLIAEGKEKISQIVDIINLKEIANDNMLFIKMPMIVRKFQNNPRMIEEIVAYVKRLNEVEL